MTYFQPYFAFRENKPVPAVVRNYTIEDFDALRNIQTEAFPPPFPQELLWQKQQIEAHVGRFPEGMLCAEINGEMAGSVTTLIVDNPGEAHTWADITDHGFIGTHNPAGNTLYVVDLCVKPAYRSLGVAKKMMQALYETVVHLNLDRLAGGGRMPLYHKYADSLTPEQYVQRVTAGAIYDPVITFLLRAGRMPAGVLEQYVEDEESKNRAALMEWQNPFKR